MIIIGGGPAGAMAAVTAARRGLSVRLLERGDRLFNKLRITGKGRCNLTNAGTQEAFLQNVVRNANFMRSSYNRFDNVALMAYIEGLGVPLKTERGQRVFPQSDNAHDIAHALERDLRDAGVRVGYHTRVQELEIEHDAVRAVITESGQRIACGACMIATGGKSYPRTGSTGDGYALARQAGHHVTDILPSLAPIQTKETWPKQVEGLSLRNVELHAWQHGRRVYTERGEMLFTGVGISGPMVLSASAHLDAAQLADAKIEIDLKPALDAGQLDARLLRDMDRNINREIRNAFVALLPRTLIPVVIGLAGLDGSKPCNQMTREERGLLLHTLKHLTLHPRRVGPIEAAIVTRGGVDTREVLPRTMGSKRVRNLYFGGEVLDLDAYTGGYNLQIAFTTGYAAGEFCEIIKKEYE